MVSPIHSEPHFKFITPSKVIRATPTLAAWGVATGVAILLFGSDVPIVRKDLLSKIPIAGRYFPVEAKHEEED